jgi:hypothetical protein
VFEWNLKKKEEHSFFLQGEIKVDSKKKNLKREKKYFGNLF